MKRKNSSKRQRKAEVLQPQQKKQKEHGEMLKTLRPGDKVVAGGGIIGVVVSVKEKSIALRSSDAKLEVLKSAVSEVVERASAPPES